jgi:hypothetical protein
VTSATNLKLQQEMTEMHAFLQVTASLICFRNRRPYPAAVTADLIPFVTAGA